MDYMQLALLERISLKALIDAYTAIAGIGNGYKTAMKNAGGLTEEQIQKRFLNLDKEAHDIVGKALNEYLEEKKEGGKT